MYNEIELCNQAASERRRTWKIVLTLLPLVLIGPLAMDMYLPALPSFSQSLGVSTYITQWTLSIFVLGFGLSQLFVGFLSSQIGSIRCLFYGLLIYILSSLCLSTLNQIHLIIILRFIQSLGACFILVISMGLVTKLITDSKENLFAYSMLSGATGLAPIIAPIIGAFLLSYFKSWHAIFVFLCLFSLIDIVIYHYAVKRLSIKPTPNNSSTNNYLTIIRSSYFWQFALVGACGMSILFTFFSLAPYLFMEYYHLSSKEFSQAFGCGALFFMLGNFLGPKAVKVFNVIPLIKMSYCALLILSLPLALASEYYHSLFIFIVLISLINSLVGLTFGPSMSNAMSFFQDCADEAASLYGFQQFLIAFAIGTVFIYLGYKSIMAYGVFITLCAGLIYLFIKMQKDILYV